jgi:oxygen-independent coproporphyrinogen-3 oxidase
MFGLYFHIPFCERKCSYCDFYSLPLNDLASEDVNRFIDALSAEVDALTADIDRNPLVGSIFFGGGTPSLLSAESVRSMIGHINTIFPLAHDCEITLEANPGTIDLPSLRQFKQAGVNRLSIGVQSFHDAELQFLDRIHTVAEARQSIADARSAGFEHLSIDLMFGIPHQTLNQWEMNLEEAAKLELEHLSCYSLTVEEGTPYHQMILTGSADAPDEQLDAEMYERAIELLTAYGYEQYEVSNFAKAGGRCRHNLNYWHHGEYLGFGPSAHSFIGNKRWWNISDLFSYLKSIEAGNLPFANVELLSNTELFNEAVFLGIRSDGVDLGRLQDRFGIALDPTVGKLKEYIGMGLIVSNGGRISLTSKGYVLCDEICSELMAEHS